MRHSTDGMSAPHAHCDMMCGVRSGMMVPAPVSLCMEGVNTQLGSSAGEHGLVDLNRAGV